MVSKHGQARRISPLDFRSKELYPKAEAAVKKALEIDNRLAEVHTSLASLLMLSKWDWANSQKEFKFALELNPNYATAHHWYSQWFLNMGRLEESLRLISDLKSCTQRQRRQLRKRWKSTTGWRKSIRHSQVYSC